MALITFYSFKCELAVSLRTQVTHFKSYELVILQQLKLMSSHSFVIELKKKNVALGNRPQGKIK